MSNMILERLFSSWLGPNGSLLSSYPGNMNFIYPWKYWKHIAYMHMLLVCFGRIRNKNRNIIEVISEDPYLAVVHAGDIPAVIHSPRQTKSPNCSEHPGSLKAKKSRCEHLFILRGSVFKMNVILLQMLGKQEQILKRQKKRNKFMIL